MFENLNQPYIFNNNFKHSLKTIMLVSMAYMLIVLYFQPFGINFLNSAQDAYFVLGTGIITAITFFTNTQILPGIFPKTFDNKKWTIKKEIILNICMFAFLSFSFGLLAYIFHIALVDYALPVFLTGALAMLPIFLFNLSNYNNSLKLKMVHVYDTGKSWLSEEAKHVHHPVKFVSENGKDTYKYDIESLILLRSSGNYVEVYSVEGNTYKKTLIRQTLSNIETVLSAHTEFVRAHRCCIVNIKQFRKISGSSGIYTVQLKGIDFDVPVSRNKVSEFRKLGLKQTIGQA